MKKWLLKILKFFDFGIKARGRNVISAICIITFISISIVFVVRVFEKANNKDFWVDETHGLEGSVREAGYMRLLIRGANGQGSPAPLDYLFMRFLYDNKNVLSSLGLPYNIYYRLNSIFWSFILGVLTIMVIFLNMRKNATNYLVFVIQGLFLVLALLFFYFWPCNFHYSAEARPYALWNSLWFTIMALFLLYKEFRLTLIILLIFLAGTATASIYQLFSLAISFIIIKVLNREKIYQVIRLTLKIYTIPVIISLYYIWRQNNFVYNYVPTDEMFNNYLKDFFIFWNGKEMIPLLSLIGILMTFSSKELQSHTVIFSTMLILYLISPIFNYLTLLRGFFFSSRQYIYYDLIYPVFLISTALLIPDYLRKIKNYLKE